MKPWAFVGAVLFAGACLVPSPLHEPSVVDTSGPDGLGTPIGDACLQLRKIGCPEGFPHPGTFRTCFQIYVAMIAMLGAEAPVVCIKASPSVAAVQACGDANQIRVRCILPASDITGSHIP